MLKTLLHLFYFELLLRLRHSQEWLYPLGFFLMVISIFPLAITSNPQVLQQFAPGFIWIAALLSSLLSINTIFTSDFEDGHLMQNILCPVPLTAIVLSKLCAQWLATSLPLIALSLPAGLCLHLPLIALPALIVTLILGTIIFTLIGCLAVALTQGLRHQGVLLGLIMLPLIIPALIFGINIVSEAALHLPILNPLLFFAGITLLAIILLPITIAGTLVISLDD